MKSFFSSTNYFVLTIVTLFFGCTTPRHLVMVDRPIRNAVAPVKELQVNSFNVETTKRDNPTEKKLFMDEFTDYLRYNPSIGEIEKQYPNLAADITIRPKKDIKRTWILDAVFFWPYVGTWPFTPWWGKTSVDIDVQLTVPGIDRSSFIFTKNSDFSVTIYPYYRAGKLLTQDYKSLYAELFDEVGNYDFVKNWNGKTSLMNGAFNVFAYLSKCCCGTTFRCRSKYSFKHRGERQNFCIDNWQRAICKRN